MSGNGHLFTYAQTNSPLHRIPAIFKLAATAVLTATVFFLPVLGLEITTVILFSTAIIARIEPIRIKGTLKVIAVYAVFIGLVRYIGAPLNPESLLSIAKESGLYLWRLFLALGTGTILYATTSTLEIREAIEDVQEALPRIPGNSRNTPDFAFSLSLTITFIPRIFDTWYEISLAWNARGGNLSRNPAAAYRRMVHLVPHLLIRLLDMAAKTDQAIQNRKKI